MSRPIEDYALVGDLQSAALVSRDGSIDWLCLPRFDSEACFAALLGDERHGYWQIAPAREITRVSRRYRPGTLILETEFTTASGRRPPHRLHAAAGHRPGADPADRRGGRPGRHADDARRALRVRADPPPRPAAGRAPGGSRPARSRCGSSARSSCTPATRTWSPASRSARVTGSRWRRSGGRHTGRRPLRRRPVPWSSRPATGGGPGWRACAGWTRARANGRTR